MTVRDGVKNGDRLALRPTQREKAELPGEDVLQSQSKPERRYRDESYRENTTGMIGPAILLAGRHHPQWHADQYGKNHRHDNQLERIGQGGAMSLMTGRLV